MKFVFFIALIGKTLLTFMAKVGIFVRFTWKILAHAVTGPMYLKILFNQLVQIGFLSLPVIGLTAVFTGAALALQIYS